SGTLDTELLKMLKELRKKIAKQKLLPPFVIFQDPSLDEMCTHYPVSLDELKQMHGVGAGKALKFGKLFVALIKQNVDENDIDRQLKHVNKSIAKKSAIKVLIIQKIDGKICLDDFASSKGISSKNLIKEVETIINSRKKLITGY